MAITLKANVRWGGVDYAPGATIPGLTPSDEAGLVSSNRAEWVGTPSTTITAAVPVMATTGPGGGIVISAGDQDVTDQIGGASRPMMFNGFEPSLVPSLVAGATASRAGDVITVTATSHGIPTAMFDSLRVYFPGSNNIASGWKSNFQRVSSDMFTCVDTVSGAVSSESINAGTAMTAPVRVAGDIMPAGSIGPRGRFVGHHGYAAGATAATKSLYYTLGGIRIMQAAAAGAGDVSFVAQGVQKQIGQAGLTAAADLTKDQRIDVYVQISAAADYVVVSNVSGEYVYAKDAPTYTPPAFPALKTPTLVELAASAPRVIASKMNDGYVYGKHDSNTLYRSTDGARTWEKIGATGALGGDAIGLILPAGDGEALLVGAANIYKTTGWAGPVASVTRTAVLASSTVAQFQTWGVDSDGAGRCIATHYAASSNFTASRYVWYSSNYGTTWTVVRDLGGTGENDQHLHFVLIDKYANGRLYVNHHQETDAGTGKSIEYSDDNGATWQKVPHIRFIQSDGTIRVIQPTTAVALPEGLVMGSDDPDTGLYILRRGENRIEYFARGANESGPLTVRSFATFSFIDQYDGLTYTAFKQQTTGGRGYVMVSDGVTGSVVFEDTLGFPVSGQTAMGGYLPGFYSIATTATEVLGTVVRPSAADPAKNAYWLFRASKI